MNIKNLADLQTEKQKLEQQISLSKKAFVNSFNGTQVQAKELFIKKIVTPFSIVGLAVLGIRQLTDRSPASTAVKNDSQHFLLKLLPVALPLIQSFLQDNDYINKLFTDIQEAKEIGGE